MPLIRKAPAPPDKETVPVRLDRPLFVQLRDYAAFVEGSKDYVIAAALERLFKADRDFAAWQQQRRTSPRGEGAGPGVTTQAMADETGPRFTTSPTTGVPPRAAKERA
jgi:hypothetical protein